MKPTIGAPTSLTIASLTGSYQFTVGIDLQLYDSVTLALSVTTSHAAKTLNIKPQWSPDDVTYYDEEVDVAGTAASAVGGEQGFYASSKRLDYSLAAVAALPIQRYQRLHRYFRIAYKEAAGTSTAIVTAIVRPANVF